eukprot:1944687-Amphidinium_carterae.1
MPTLASACSGPACENLAVYVAEAQGQAMLQRRAHHEHHLSMAKNLIQFAHENAEWLNSKQLFQEWCSALSSWWAVPHPIGVSYVATFSASAVVDDIQRSRKLLAMSEGWEARHVGVRCTPKDRSTAAVRYSPCRYTNICVCKPGFFRILTTRVSAMLRELVVREVLSGDVVLLWRHSSWVHADAAVERAFQDFDEEFNEGVAFHVGMTLKR